MQIGSDEAITLAEFAKNYPNEIFIAHLEHIHSSPQEL